MDTTMIGTFAAKTHLSEILKKVQSGKTFVITNRGEPVAKIGPVQKEQKQNDMKKIVKAFDEIRDEIKEPVDIKACINEGRKY